MSDDTVIDMGSTVTVSDTGVVDPASMETTISYEKITDVEEDVIDHDNNVNNNHVYRLFNMQMLANLFSPLTCLILIQQIQY